MKTVHYHIVASLVIHYLRYKKKSWHTTTKNINIFISIQDTEIGISYVSTNWVL